MTPNDKLPEEIQGQINNEAYGHVKGLSIEHSKAHQKAGYISGATEWAGWKVKYNELQAQAKCMADALEMTIRHAKECEELYNISGDAVIESAEAVLQQFKDGKEVGPVKEIEYMPIHPEDARKFDCPTQFPMHLLNEDQAQSNHGQTLKRLKERGGLSVREILAIVGEKKWNYYGNLQWPEAIKMLNDILTNPK